MSFQVKKIADVGTENPVVARLSYQWFEIFRWFDLPPTRRNAVLEIMFDKVQPRILECQRISQSLRADIAAAGAKGVIRLDGPHHYEVPAVLRLKERAEDYLSDAKLALRDFAGIFAPLLQRDAPPANFAAMAKWSEKSFGDSDPLTRRLKTANDEWIRRLCNMRDAMEHPEGKLGPLAIHDFAFDPTDPDNIILYEPNWHLKAGQPAAISPDLEYYDRMLFAFFEETLMEALRHVRTHVPVSFVDIPESERNSAAPIRYRPVFDSADGSLAPVPAGTMSESQTVIPDLQRLISALPIIFTSSPTTTARCTS